ncbi:MAG: ABC transporter permease [Chloroflexi bacterium]|nr:MAG: ABC transporter permease [Chloroflexota bacterium]
MSAWSWFVIGTFLAIYGVLALLALRRPLLARLAFREAWRGGLQTGLVVAGLALAGMGITAGLVAADSTEASVTQNAYLSMGEVDLTVTGNGALFDASVADRLAADRNLATGIDGVQGGLDLVGAVADLDQRASDTAVRLYGFDASRQRPFGAFHLVDGRRTYGDDLPPAGVLVSRDLADALHAQAGDRLRISAGASSAEVLVAGLVKLEGPGAFGLGRTLFAPLGSIPSLAAAGNQINVVRLSTPGDGLAGIAAGRRSLPAVREAVAGLGVPGLEVNEAKAAQVRQAERSTQSARATLVTMSLLVVAAAATVVVHLTLMLAEERRRRLGTLRALGLSRSGLVFLSVLESALYSLAGAVVGVLPGLALARYLGQVAAEAGAALSGSESTGYQLAVRPETVAVAVSLAAMLTVVTMAAAALRTARFAISAAIRDLPEPASKGGRRWRLLAAGLLAAAGFAIALAGGGAGRVLGATLMIVGATWAGRRWIEDRARYTLAGTLILAWALVVQATTPLSSEDNAAFAVFFVGIVVSVFGLSLVVAANLALVDRFLALVSPRLGATLRAPVAYMTRRPLRTGLTTGAFGIVLAAITVFAVVGGSYQPDYARDSAGFDVIVRSAQPAITLSPALQAQIARAEVIPTRLYLGRFLAPNSTGYAGGDSTYVPLYTLSEAQLANPPLHLSTRSQRFPDDASVWRAMREDPGLVVAATTHVDDTITMWTPTGPVHFTVVAQPVYAIFNGLIGSPRSFSGFDLAVSGSTLLLAARPGVDREGLARAIESELFEQGVTAHTFRSEVSGYLAAIKAILAVIDTLMRLGLAIGLLTLGIAGLRAVVERRRPIGVLRALGFSPRRVVGGLVVEAILTAAIGIAVGVTAGLLLGYLVVTSTYNREFNVDGGALASAIVLVLAATLAVTIGPAMRASRLPAADALRLMD